MTDSIAVRMVLKKYADDNLTDGDRMILDEPFPFERYNVYRDWKPSSTKVLLIGESPPWNHRANYFYNPDFEGGLSSRVFDLFHIRGKTKTDKLSAFKDRGFFLIDTVPCIFVKKDMKSIPEKRQRPVPSSLIELGAVHYLKDEITALAPKCILTVHATAYEGIRHIDPFKSCLPTDASIGRVCGNSYQCEDKTVIVSVFPCSRNSSYNDKVVTAFSKASVISRER